jgi:two-component system LytT family sensor kinase
MNHQMRPSTSNSADFLLSWDRLGFRLLVFGGLGFMWMLQGRLHNQAWSDLILAELVVLMPWAFLAPIMLSWIRRVQLARLGLGRRLAAHLLGMVLVFIPYWLLRRGIALVWDCFALGWDATRLSGLVPTQQNLLGTFLNVPLAYFLILLGSEAMKHAQARREEELQAGRLAGQLAEARLALLQRQLHPHFLFNALQAISTLLHRDPKTADGLLVRLSTLLRAMLEQASGQTLSLRTELDLTRKYLEIEQVRFADRLAVEWEVDPSLFEAQVPSLIVLPLVENAIRHGLSPKVGPGRLKISAGSDGTSLVLTVEDDGLGTTLPLGPGVGIGNTRERLVAMYGGKAGLEIEPLHEGGFRARIRIPLEEGRS